MCGIIGFLGGIDTPETGASLLHKMAESLAHRGPDGQGIWINPEYPMGLGHRRLAILDLTEAGNQPMHSPSTRYVLVINGEIYNHQALRKKLPHIAWKGQSDTETFLAAIDTLGLIPTLEQCSGMFAFALWDKQTQTLTLGRDRIGEKPLYYGWMGTGNHKTFVFGSELKALRHHPLFTGTLNRQALSGLMQLGYIAAPNTIYQDLSKLFPGTLLTLSWPSLDEKTTPYWSLQNTIATAQNNPFLGTTSDAIFELETLLKTTLANHLISDVPVGLFLSGGIDSSTVVALAQTQSTKRLKTFSMGFTQPNFNEAPYAKTVAKHLGTDHTELIVSSEDAFNVIPKLATVYDEPFGDSSQLPTFLLAEMAKKQVTVALSGDGGDELFCGYNRYRLATQLWQTLQKIPLPLRQLGHPLLARLSAFVPGNLGDKLYKGSPLLACSSQDQIYQSLIRQHPDFCTLVLHTKPTFNESHFQALTPFSNLDPTHTMMAIDTLTYLPDDLMVKVDRATMAVSLENRAPFLDHRIVEFAQRLPATLKYQNGETKWILRQILGKYLPQNIIHRPKMGFSIPIADWLRGPLRDWAENLLHTKTLTQQGYLNPALIEQKWSEHLCGKHNWSHCLWTVLMFQSWLENIEP